MPVDATVLVVAATGVVLINSIVLVAAAVATGLVDSIVLVVPVVVLDTEICDVLDTEIGVVAAMLVDSDIVDSEFEESVIIKVSMHCNTLPIVSNTMYCHSYIHKLSFAVVISNMFILRLNNLHAQVMYSCACDFPAMGQNR